MNSDKTSGPHVCVHLTAYRDPEAVNRTLSALEAQTRRPDQIVVVDNSPECLALRPSALALEYVHQPHNPGTAGAINHTLRSCRNGGADFLWILDQDSIPSPGLLASLLDAHRLLANRSRSRPVGIIAPLTRNRDDDRANQPLRFDRYRARPVEYDAEPVECDFLPAAGMLLHLPSLSRLEPPSDRYFLDVYDFALGLAVKRAGADVWLAPALQLSHQVGRKVSFAGPKGPRILADMPAFRVRLLHRNSTYLFTRTARFHHRPAAIFWQLKGAALHAIRFVRYPFEDRWAKAAAAPHGWLLGLFGLRKP